MINIINTCLTKIINVLDNQLLIFLLVIEITLLLYALLILEQPNCLVKGGSWLEKGVAMPPPPQLLIFFS